MIRELVIGASGLVGTYIYKTAQRNHGCVTGTYFRHPLAGLCHLDLTDQRAVDRLLEDVDPDVIYLTASQPNVDWVEDHPHESRAVNVDGPVAITRMLRGSRCLLVYYSSDYVFDGRYGPYDETAIPRPINEYGRQKLEVERVIQETLDRWLILRVTVVYGWEHEPKNFAHRSLCILRAGGTVKAPIDQVGNPTYAANLAEVSRELALAGVQGLFHVAGPERASRYAFAREIARVFNLDEGRILPVATPELGQRARRPLNAGLIVTRVNSILKTKLEGYHEGLRRMKAEEGSTDGGST